jgi:hypothetical protein
MFEPVIVTTEANDRAPYMYETAAVWPLPGTIKMPTAHGMSTTTVPTNSGMVATWFNVDAPLVVARSLIVPAEVPATIVETRHTRPAEALITVGPVMPNAVRSPPLLTSMSPATPICGTGGALTGAAPYRKETDLLRRDLRAGAE